MPSFANQGPQDQPPTSQYPPGPQLFDPSIIAAGGGHSPADGIVAHAGGGQAAATPLRASISRITTCATAADSVCLPRSAGGQFIVVMNAGAAACQVFAAPGSSDTINGVAGSTGVSLAAAKSAAFSSPAVGVWFWNLSA
jgi:hypothetical protein